MGEQDSRITAFAVEQDTKGNSLKSFSQSLKLDGGQKVASVTLSRSKSQPDAQDASHAQKFFVAVACWEQCRIQVYQLNFKVVVDRGGFRSG